MGTGGEGIKGKETMRIVPLCSYENGHLSSPCWVPVQAERMALTRQLCPWEIDAQGMKMAGFHGPSHTLLA